MFKTGAGIHLSLHVKCPWFLSNSNRKWNVLTSFSETPQSQISWKYILPFYNCYMHTQEERIVLIRAQQAYDHVQKGKKEGQ
jgi:hypothetical protein